MIRALLRYLFAFSKLAIRGWEHFWFASRSTFDVGMARVALGILASIYIASWWGELHSWTETNGMLSSSVTRFLIGDQVEGTGSVGRVSLLYRAEAKWMTQGYLIASLLCSVAMALGIGGRIMAAAVWFLVLGIVHRVPMLQGAGDLLFTGILGYLVIDPGKIKNQFRIALDDRAERWSASLAVRLMQCHVMIWLLVSFVSHLAEPMWWAGSATWWLASGQLSPWFNQEFLSDKPYLINALSHAFILVHLMTIGLLMRRDCRPLGIVSMVLMATGVWLLAGDWFYSLALVLCTAPFWGIGAREFLALSMNGEESAAVPDAEKVTQSTSQRNTPTRRAMLHPRSRLE